MKPVLSHLNLEIKGKKETKQRKILLYAVAKKCKIIKTCV